MTYVLLLMLGSVIGLNIYLVKRHEGKELRDD